MSSGIQLISEKEETVSGPTQFNDPIDENKPVINDAEKRGKGRKILGIFGRTKRKDKRASNNRYEAGDGEVDASLNEIDASILSDAVLRDRHDRFVTKI